MNSHLSNNPPDPVLDELHAFRRRLLRDCGGVHGLALLLKEHESNSLWPVADLPAHAGASKSLPRSGGTGAMSAEGAVRDGE